MAAMIRRTCQSLASRSYRDADFPSLIERMTERSTMRLPAGLVNVDPDRAINERAASTASNIPGILPEKPEDHMGSGSIG